MWSVRELQYLVAVSDNGSFTDGADELGVTQAAVSRAIAGVERRIGARLLDRTPRGCEPTPLGVRVVTQARRVLAEVERLDEIVATRHVTLRLGYAWAALGRHTTPLMRGWVAVHPDVDLRLVRSDSPTAGLVEGRADVAVLRAPPDDARLDSVVVGSEPRVVAFAADDRRWGRRRRIAMAEFADRVVAVDPRTGTTSEALWGSGPRPAGVVAVSGLSEWLDAIAVGGAVGVTSEATAEHHRRPGVVFRPIRDVPPITVRLGWWRAAPPVGLAALVADVTRFYAGPAS